MKSNPPIAEADKALANGSSDALVKLVNDDVAAGIQKRYERALATYKHKDESVKGIYHSDAGSYTEREQRYIPMGNAKLSDAKQGAD